MYMRKIFVREVIEYYLHNYPKLTNKQIHQLTGTSQSYVSVLRNKLGYEKITDGRVNDEIKELVYNVPKPSDIIKAVEKTWRVSDPLSKGMQMMEIHHYANKYAEKNSPQRRKGEF